MVAEYAQRVAKTPKELIALTKLSINRSQELQGFRAALMQGIEVDTVAHVSEPAKQINQYIRDNGLREAMRAFEAGELL